MSDDEPFEMRVLARIGKTLERILPDAIVVADLVYRPVGMGVFGGKGYTMMLATKDRTRRHGVRFENPPTAKQIREGVLQCIRVMRKGAKKQHDRA
jgi:hypothetical protein